MWFIYDKIEFKDDLVSRAGKRYSGWLLQGEKKGFNGEPNQPWQKTLFESTAATVIEKGIDRPNCSVVQFFQKACQPGDTVIITQERRVGTANMWDIVSVQKLGDNAPLPTYEPLTEEQLQQETLKSKQIHGSEAAMAATTTPPWAMTAR